MMYVLDTNICVYWMKGNEDIEQKALSVGLDQIAVPFIALSELYYGAYKSRRIEENLAAIETLKSNLALLEWSEDVCEVFGRLKATLEKDGKTLHDADIFVAACALANNSVLVTNNEKHFDRIQELKLENWSNQYSKQ